MISILCTLRKTQNCRDDKKDQWLPVMTAQGFMKSQITDFQATPLPCDTAVVDPSYYEVQVYRRCNTKSES